MKRTPAAVIAEDAARLKGAFPPSLSDDVDAALSIFGASRIPPTRDDIGAIRVEGVSVRIPMRLYHAPPEPGAADGLSATGRTVLACLLTRHHDGFVRERYAAGLLSASEPWVTPFVIQLVGEYVVQIIILLAKQNPEAARERYQQFGRENPGFIATTRRRVVSYWSCYYRSRELRLRDYPGFQILNALGLWDDRGARRILRG